MKNILISSYGVCPDVNEHPGSEFSISWNFVNKLARTKKYNITLLVGSSDGELRGLNNLKNVKIDNVNIVYVKTNIYVNSIFRFFYHKLGIKFIWPIYLRFWNQAAFKVASKLHKENKFDIVHQYNPGGFKNPGYLWKLGVKSVWGPVFGLHFFNLRLAYAQSFSYFLKCIIWNSANYLFRFDLYVINGAKKYNKIWFGTNDTGKYFKKFFNVIGSQVSEQSISNTENINEYIKGKSNETLKIIWIGRVEYRKNLKLFLDICKSIKNPAKKIEVYILGKGPLLHKYKKYWEKDKSDVNLSFLNHMPRNKLLKLMEECHVVSFTSMAEGNTSVIFEAMEKGLIPIALDSHGFSSSISYNMGIKINTMDPYKNVLQNYRNEILNISKTEVLGKYQSNLINYAHLNSWEETIKKHISVYEE